jgi:hypothetical protein
VRAGAIAAAAAAVRLGCAAVAAVKALCSTRDADMLLHCHRFCTEQYASKIISIITYDTYYPWYACRLVISDCYMTVINCYVTQVSEGLEVLESMSEVPVDTAGRPLQNIR